jgi:hypothetical protein
MVDLAASGPEVVDLSGVSDLDGRRIVLRALQAFDAAQERESQATEHLYTLLRKLEKLASRVEKDIAKIQDNFRNNEPEIVGYPALNSPYQMHEDHTGCYTCEISGLPLRNDDQIVDWGDGYALYVLAARRLEIGQSS